MSEVIRIRMEVDKKENRVVLERNDKIIKIMSPDAINLYSVFESLQAIKDLKVKVFKS